MSNPWKSIIFSVEGHNSTAITLLIFDNKGSLQIICFAGDGISFRFEIVEELTDMIMCIELCVCKFGI